MKCEFEVLEGDNTGEVGGAQSHGGGPCVNVVLYLIMGP